MPDTRHCILTGVPLTEENDSRAHVIPSALGGRLKPWGILSRQANVRLGDTIDLLLIEALAPLMTHLNASRDRGTNQPILMEDAHGAKYRMAFDEPLRPAQPLYEETEEAGETRIRIEARTLKEARTLLGKIKAKHPRFDIDEAMKHAVVAREWPDGGVLKASLEIGPRRTFPALFVAASIFAAAKGFQPHPAFRNFVDGFDVDEPAMPVDTFYFYLPEGAVAAPGEVTHKIVLLSDPGRRQSLLWLDLFGILEVAVLHPYQGLEGRLESYGVDILLGEEVPVSVDRAALLKKTWSPSHEIGPALMSLMKARVGRVIGISQRRASDAQTEHAVQEVLANLPRPLTGAGLLNALTPVVEFTKLEVRRPTVSKAVSEAQATHFADLLLALGQLLGPGERDIFATGAAPLIEEVAAAARENKAA